MYLMVRPVSVVPAFTCTGEVSPVSPLLGVQIVTDGLAGLRGHVACALARGIITVRAAATSRNLATFTTEQILRRDMVHLDTGIGNSSERARFRPLQRHALRQSAAEDCCRMCLKQVNSHVSY